MSWEIPIPFQSRDQTISDALAAGVDQELHGEDRDVAFHLLLHAKFETVGQLLNHVEGLDDDDRKALLDETRKSAGLPTTRELEDVAKLRQLVRDDPPRPLPQPEREQDGRLLQQCAASGCDAMSTDASGAIVPVKARKWWCEAHRDDPADPRDLDDWEPEQLVSLNPLTGGLVFPEEQRLAAEFYAREAEQRDQERAKRQEHQEAEEERIRVLEEQFALHEPAAPDAFMALHRGVR